MTGPGNGDFVTFDDGTPLLGADTSFGGFSVAPYDQQLVVCATCPAQVVRAMLVYRTVPDEPTGTPVGECRQCADDFAAQWCETLARQASRVKCATCPAMVGKDGLIYREAPESVLTAPWGPHVYGQCLECVAVARILTGRVAPAPPVTILARRPRHGADVHLPELGLRTFLVEFERIGDRCRFETGLPAQTLTITVAVDEALVDPVVTQLKQRIADHAAALLSGPPEVWFFPDGTAPVRHLDGCEGSLLNVRGHCVGRFTVTAQKSPVTAS